VSHRCPRHRLHDDRGPHTPAPPHGLGARPKADPLRRDRGYDNGRGLGTKAPAAAIRAAERELRPQTIP
jgi:hypothetical protein